MVLGFRSSLPFVTQIALGGFRSKSSSKSKSKSRTKSQLESKSTCESN